MARPEQPQRFTKRELIRKFAKGVKTMDQATDKTFEATLHGAEIVLHDAQVAIHGLNNKPRLRRNVLRGGAALAAAWLIKKHIPERVKEKVTQELHPDTEGIRGLFYDNKKFTGEIEKRADSYMGLEPGEERSRQEKALIDYLDTENASAGDLIHALESFGSVYGRGAAMELLWRQIESGELRKYGVNPLDDDHIKWAKEHNIDKRTLAIAKIARKIAEDLLKAAPDVFLEATSLEERKKIDMSKRLPNAGLMSELTMTETRSPYVTEPFGHVFIGTVIAWDSVNLSTDYFPSAHADLEEIAKQLTKTTGLPYKKYVKFLPGSARGPGDGSGGAVGEQFMPLNARIFSLWYTTANERLKNKYPAPNVFNPITGTVLKYLMLASEYYHRHPTYDSKTDVVRVGFVDGDAEKEEASVAKWNGNSKQISSVLAAGKSYKEKFGNE